MTTPEQILIYDGDCGICTRSATWIERRWTMYPPPRIVPYFPSLDLPSRTELQESVWWIDGRRRDAGSRAVAGALLATSSAWQLVGYALLVPPISWIAPPLYRVVARHRHRLF